MLLAVLISASLGSAEFVVDEDNTTAPHTQQPQSLTLLSPVSFATILSGEFTQSFDWSPVNRIFLDAAIVGNNPAVLFSLELYRWNGSGFELINIYEGSTAGLSTSFGLLELSLSEPGSGDFSNFRGVQFTCTSPPEASGGLTIRSVVGLAGPIVPVVTSTSYAGGDFTLTWSGTGALPVIVERRDSLQTGQWTAIAQGVATGEYTDTDPPAGMAFYRVVVP